MTLMSKMNVSDIQRRLSNYVPTTYQSIYGFAASFKDGFVGSLDTAAEIAVEIGGTIAVDTAIGAAFFGAPTAGGAAPVGAVVGAAVGVGRGLQILYKTLSAAKQVMSSAWYLTGYGKLPRLAMQWGVLRTTGASALVGATSNSLIDYVGQKENIALANSLYFYNPDMQSVFSMDEVVGAAAAGALFGASLGMVGHVISTVAVRGNNAAARNAFAQQGIDPAFAPQQRNPFQRTKDNIAAFRNRKAVTIQDPIAGAIQTAVSKGVDPTVVDINAAARTTSTAIDAASVASNPKDAANLPDHSLNRRQPNEPMRAFTIRAVLGKFVTSVTDLLDADSAGGRFSLLTPREQYLTLLRTEDHMRDFSAMTDIETDLTNKAAGQPEQMRIIDPVTGRSSSPANNVAKLYGELDEARSILEKTISKEDQAEARLAHKNGTELAPRTISSAVDKATSNVRGIMENASEGRHNPSEATGPKVEPPATAEGENAAQGTTAPALPTQKKVDEITQDTAEDMSLLTDAEMEDPKVTGAIERNINRQLFGEEKEHTLRSLSRGLAKARKLTPDQQKNINASLDNPRSFLKNATGNKTYIKNFFNRLDQLVTLGHITDVDRRIILASTVNTSFTSNVAAKISDMGTRADDRASTSLAGDIKIGKLDTSVAGNTRVENVLHEIGHVEELHAYGSSLMDMRKLFTSEQAFLDAAQQVLGTDNFNKYYLAGNTQELMAQVKAKMMIDEVKLAVFLKTANSNAVEKTLLHRFLSVGTTLVEVFNSLKLSKVDAEDEMYTAVKNVLSQLEKNSGPLMTRITYQNRVTAALKQFPATGKKLSPAEKVAFTKVLNDKISAKLTKTEPSLKDMLFTKDEVQSLHALTVHADGTVDPIRLDAYLNVKRDGITVKNRAKFAQIFQSYMEINKRYLASTVDIHIQSMKENGYRAVPNNPIIMDSSLNRKDQIIALREYHKNLTPEQLVVTPSYLDISFGSFQGIQSINFLLETAADQDAAEYRLEMGDLFAPQRKPTNVGNYIVMDTVRDTLDSLLTSTNTNELPRLPQRVREATNLLKSATSIDINKFTVRVVKDPKENVGFIPNTDNVGGVITVLDRGSIEDNKDMPLLLLTDLMKAMESQGQGKRLKKVKELLLNKETKFDKMFKDTVVTYPNSTEPMALRHSSPLPIPYEDFPSDIRFKIGLTGGDEALGAGVYFTNNGKDGSKYGNYNTDVYVNIKKPFIVDTLGYLKKLKTDPRRISVPFSSTRHVFNYQISYLLEKFITENKIEIDPTWLKNLQNNRLHAVRDLPDNLKEALELQDGTWQKSYEKIGIWEEQKLNLISQELLDSAGNDPYKLNDIMREHSSRASITVPVQAEARIIAHRLLQRMGYDGIFAPSFQYNDYSGQVTVTNNDHYVILDPKQARSINNVSFNETATGLMFAPKAKLPVAYTKTTAVRRLATLSNEISDSPQTNAEFKNNIQTMFGVDDKLFTALLSNIKKPEVSITTTRKIPVVKEEPVVPLTPEQIKAQEQKALYSTVPDENIITDPSLIGTTDETIRGTGTGELVNYHQTIIRRIVKALDSGKLTVGVNGIRRLNLVERKLAILDVHEHAQLVNDLEIADAKFEPSDLSKINELINAREDDDLNNSKLRPNDPLTGESLNRFWKERFDVARQIGSRLKKKFSSLGFKNSQTSLDAILTAMNTAQALGDATLVRKDGTIRTRNHLLNYLANSAWQIIIKELTPQETRAGLTGSNWGLFIETENEIINSSYYTDVKELTYDGTNEQWMESEKKRGSMLYQQFVKAYGTKYDLKGEASNVEGEPPQLVSTIRGEDKEYSAKLDRKSKAFRFIIDLAEENKYSLFDKKDKGWMEFVVRNIIEGKEYAEIVTLGRDVGYNKTVNNVKDAHRFFKENVKKFTELFLPEGLTIDDLDGNQVLASMVVENMRKKTELDSDLAFKTKTENEILQDSQRATEEQNNTDELEQHIDTTDPAEETSQPVISPKESEEPVTAVIQVDGKTTPVTGLTPHVTPVVAERVVQQGRNPNGQFTSSTPKRAIKFITGDFRAWGKATGVAGKLFFASFKTMEGILLSLPKDSLKKINVAQAVDILTRLFEEGKEKEAIKQFMSLMEHLDIEGVKLIDPKDGRTVMNFIFDQHQWSYGGISRFVEPKVAPKTEAKVAPKTEAKAKPKAAPAKTTTPTVTTPTTAAAVAPSSKPKPAGKGTAPDGTTVPVIQPKAVEVTDLPEGSHIPIISEHDRIANGLIESNESLRDGGVDATSFTALFKKFVRSLSKDARKKLGTGIPESFKSVFIDFVELNASIMHHNRTIFGSEKIIQKFWKQVDILLAVEDGLTIKNQLRVRKSMKEIYAIAADMVSINNTKFIPPVTHDSVIMRNGKFSLGTVSKEVKSVLDARDTSGNPLIPYTAEELRSREQVKPKDTPLPGVANSKITRAPEEELVPEVELTNSDRIDTIASKVNNSSNMLLRQNNFISLIFGGSERSNRNRWRLFMSKAVNFIQMGSNMGSTLRSMHLTVRFLSMFMDDSRAMTGQLVSPEGIPIKSAAKAKQDAVMFTANLTRIHHTLSAEAIALKMTPEEKKLLQKIQIQAWKNKTSPTSSELTAAFGEKDFSKLESILKNYRLELIHLNTEVLKLEEKTQWRTVVDKNGDLVEAEDYLPIQVHVEKLMSILSDNQRYKTLMASIVNTRKESKLADDMLDVNTLITMGILNIEKQNTFYTKNRKFALTSGSMLDSDSLSKLYEYSVASNANLDFSKQLGIKGKDWFLIEKGNEAKIYRIPKTIEDLSEADLVKYRDTVKGEQQHVTSQWKQEFNGKSLIEVEMKELLDFKTKQGKYHYSKTTMVDNRPVLDRNHHDDYFSTVRNFSVEELLSDSELFNIARTDLHSAYQNFAKYRMFDLIFQESIDQLAGSTGLRPKDFFRLLEAKVHKHIEDFDSIKAVDKKANHDDVASGFSRLIWQYAQYNGSIPRLGAESRIIANVSRATRNLVSTSSGLGWGLSQAPETVMEILKNIPSTKGLSVPVGMFKYLNNLLKFWDRGDSATRLEVGDLITSLEEYSKDHSTHFNEGTGDVDFDSDTSKPYRAIWNSGRNSTGLTGNTADFLEKTGQTVVLAGGVTDGTNLARYYGKARHVRDLTAMMRDGKLKEFLRLRALPENRAAMQALLEGSFKSAAEERKLWKMHKSLARQAGGLDSLLALKAIKVGLDSPAKLEAMMYGMNAANALDGVLDFRDLHMVYRDLKNMKDPPIDPELYRAAASDFQYGIEGLVRKRTVTHGFGLNQTLSAFHSSEVGKLLGSLTSYMRSWFDDVMLNAPERGAVGLMFGGIISVAVLETVISLLREWMSGREMEDIMAELENDPSEFVLRIATRMPVMGSLSPVFEGSLREIKYMTGGAQRGSDQLIKSLTSLGGGSPNVGINSVASLLNTVKDASGDIIDGSMEGDSKLVAKGLLKVPGHFINKSPQMLPVRILEEQMDLDDKHTAQFIIDGLQKKPYRYLSQQRGGSGGFRGGSKAAPQSPVAAPVTTQTMPQSAALKAAQRPEMGRQVKQYVPPVTPSKPNSGVSERLGKLLDNPSYTPTPPM
jgi:hypothetical protein